MKFRKRPMIIEATQFTEELAKAYILDKKPLPEGVLCGASSFHPSDRKVYSAHFYCMTLEGELTISYGDWIIKGAKGEFYPCKPDIFELTYDPAE